MKPVARRRVKIMITAFLKALLLAVTLLLASGVTTVVQSVFVEYEEGV